MRTRNEKPVKYVGKRGTKWIARYTNKAGKRVSAGTYELKGPCRNPRFPAADCCAQHAIDAAYDKEDAEEERRAATSVGEYARNWTDRYPRGERTNYGHDHRLSRVLDVEIEGRKLRDWPYRELRRRHGVDLLVDLLVVQGRAAEGARGILRTMSAMTTDAIADDLAELNPFMGIKVREDDRRVRKAKREPIVYSLEQMHAFAAGGDPRYVGMIRAFSDWGFRLGEVLGLAREDYTAEMVTSRGTVTPKGKFVPGNTPTKKHCRSVPVAPSTAALIMPRIDTLVLFPTPSGGFWQQTNFYKRVWKPARDATPSMAEATPQDFRHSWVSYMRAQGIDHADLAEMGGHSVETQTGIYTHPLNRSADAVRRAIG